MKVTEIDDDILIAIATTASSTQVRLAAEIALRKKYPSKAAAKKRSGKKSEG